MIKIVAYYGRYQNKTSLSIEPGGILHNETEASNENDSQMSKYKIQMPSRSALAMLHLLQENAAYRKLFSSLWNDDISIKIRLKPEKDLMDVQGNQLSSILLWEYIELEDALHWLSTLGGAFSNLGEHDRKFAVKAGDNALKQLIVAQKFGDKMVIAKCWLFVAMSLMQQEYFDKAAFIVKRVHAHCRNARGIKDLAGSGKLVAMCRGIWARLQYEARKSQNSTPAQNNEEVEIEFKFTPPSDFLQKLEDLGAEKLKFKTMKDVYLDTPKFELIRKDNWLRYRDGKIELKVPVESEHHRARNTVYKELTCLRDIEQHLGYKVPPDVENLSDGWIILATVETRRQHWAWQQFNIVHDKLPDGFEIGEIELVSSSSDPCHLAAMTAKLDKIAAQLGLAKQVKGKVNHCLRAQNPEAFKILSDEQEKYENEKP